MNQPINLWNEGKVLITLSFQISNVFSFRNLQDVPQPDRLLLLSPSMTQNLPEVTISPDVEELFQTPSVPSIAQDHSFLATSSRNSLGSPETRIIRSHSLTTTGSDQRSSSASPDWSYKIRSNSITFGARDISEKDAEASYVTEGLGSKGTVRAIS